MIHYIQVADTKTNRVKSHGQSATGYGAKITTPYMVRLRGETKWRRVYATCYSNCASHWIVIKGKQLHVNI